jgi:hypothetical protein
LNRENKHEKQAEPEDGHGDAEKSTHHAQIIKKRILLRGRDDPCNQTDEAGDQNGEKRELNGEKKTLLKEFDDRFTIPDRYSEVSLDYMRNELEVLNVKRLIQTVFFSNCLDKVWIGILPSEQHSGVSGNDVKQGKGDE